MLELAPLTADNFAFYEEKILASEEIFPANIRESSEDYLDALSQERSVGLVAHVADRYVGNVVGFQPVGEQYSILRLDEVQTSAADLIYLFNIVAMPEFQGRGIGKKLLAAFLSRSREEGFRRVGGHFRGNGSLKNFKTMGG
ncbi:MAG: GNAT family N-acetyltransferase [Desulfobacteraceae bacterium]|nr:GNAT family N-acetyltransferase [Desulfobacteraceae bacterium]